MNRLVSLLVAIAVAVPVLACEAPVTAAVVKEILRVEGRKNVVFAKQSRGVMRPLIAKVTTELRSTVIAEEILADFEERNVETVELDAPNAVDLKDYMGGAGIDWTRLEREFPGVELVVELSRPGCDSQSAFAIVQARYRLRDERFPDEGRVFHAERRPDGWVAHRTVVWNAEHLAQ